MHHSTVLAALWMAGWLAAMVLIAVAAREAGKLLHVFQIMEIRSLVGILLFLPLVAAAGGARAIRTRHFRRHFSRNAVHYVAQFLWFLAITMIPIAEVVAIEFTGPVWVALLATAFLGERMTRARVAAVVLGVVGVAIIVRPGLDHVDVGQVVALLAAIGFAGSIILVKSLTRTESVVSIIFWMLIIQSVIGAIPAAMVWQAPPPAAWPWLAVIAVCGTYSHFCMAHALRHADAATVVPLDFLRVPLTALAAWLVFAERFDLLDRRRRRGHSWRHAAQSQAECQASRHGKARRRPLVTWSPADPRAGRNPLACTTNSSRAMPGSVRSFDRGVLYHSGNPTEFSVCHLPTRKRPTASRPIRHLS